MKLTASADTHDFAVTEIFPDGRVLVVVYARLRERLTLVMTVYDDVSMQQGKRVMYYSTGGEA